MSTEKNIRIKQKADYTSEWKKYNPTILQNELAIDRTTREIKLGNGKPYSECLTLSDPRETFIKWSDVNTISGNYSLLTGIMINELGSNHMFSFAPDSWIIVEYSNDGGETWTTLDSPDTYGLLTTMNASNIWNGNLKGTTVTAAGRQITTQDKLRVTLDWRSSYAPYFTLSKVGLKISGVSQSMKYHCLFEKTNNTDQDDSWSAVTEISDFEGWTHWQFLNIGELTKLYFGGSFSKRMRWTFWCEEPPLETSANSGALALKGIAIYPKQIFTHLNTYCETNHLYSFNKYKNMILSNGIIAGLNNTNTTTTAKIFGNNNSVLNDNITIFGSQNNIKVKESYIFGKNNTIQECGPNTEGDIILGSNNIIYSNNCPSNKVLIGGGLTDTTDSQNNIIIGHYNAIPEQQVGYQILFANGMSDSDRQNAMEINLDNILINGTFNHKFDNSNSLNNYEALAIGAENTINGDNNFIVGSYNSLTGANSAAIGNGLTGDSENCLYIGQRNSDWTLTESNPLLVIGNGNVERSTALSVADTGTLLIGNQCSTQVTSHLTDFLLTIGQNGSNILTAGKDGYVEIGDVDGDHNDQGLIVQGELDIQGHSNFNGNIQFANPEWSDVISPSGVSLFPRCFNIPYSNLFRYEGNSQPEYTDTTLVANLNFQNVNLGFDENSPTCSVLAIADNNTNIMPINLTFNMWREIIHPLYDNTMLYFYLTNDGLLYSYFTSTSYGGIIQSPLSKIIVFPIAYDCNVSTESISLLSI